jgi:hypothetical protein
MSSRLAMRVGVKLEEQSLSPQLSVMTMRVTRAGKPQTLITDPRLSRLRLFLLIALQHSGQNHF